MKTNYIKSISLILLGCILTLGVSYLLNSTSKEEADKQSDTNTVLKTKPPASDTVPLGEAAEAIAMYRLWLKYIPEKVRLVDNSILEYSEVVIPPSERELVKCVIDTIKAQLKIGEGAIPFAPFSTRDYAYFISSEDIFSALASVENPTGIRIYTAPKGLSSDKASEVSTHVFVVPTITEENNDYIPGGKNKYVFDLTAPCPAACGSKNQLNDFTLECPNF